MIPALWEGWLAAAGPVVEQYVALAAAGAHREAAEALAQLPEHYRVEVDERGAVLVGPGRRLGAPIPGGESLRWRLVRG